MGTEPPHASPSEPNALSVEGLSLPLGAHFQRIQQEWDKAEAAIKRSELTTLDVAVPAVKELRYAGRRIVDALVLASEPSDNAAKIQALLDDAEFCCHRAQHDAIDVAVSKIAIDLDNLTSRLGFEAVTQAYPAFREFYADFAVVREKIVVSRENRKERGLIYDVVTETDLPSLIKRYELVMAVRPMAKRFALKMRLGSINGLLLTIVAIATCIFAAMAVDWNKWLPHDAPAAAKPAARPSALSAPSPSS